MEFSSIKGTSLLKSIVLTGLCGLLIMFAIQIDLPNLQEIADTVQIKFVQHQLERGTFSQEKMLKEGWLYFNLGQHEKARQFMEQAAAGDTNISALYCLGLIDMKYRQFEDAIAKFKTVAGKSPKHFGTRLALGEAYFQLRYWGQAAGEFETAVKLEPTDETARLWLGKTFISLNQMEKARTVLETVSHGREASEAANLLKTISHN